MCAISYMTGGGTYRLQSSIGTTNTTIKLSSFLEPVSGTPYTMAIINTSKAYGTLDPQTPDRSEFISFTGITQYADGTATLTGVTRGLSRSYPYTTSTTFKQTHSGQSIFVMSNSPQIYNDIYTYIDAAAIAGGVPATTSLIGLSKLSTAPVDALHPIAVENSDTRIPAQGENDALAGTSGTPSSTNKYVTNDDATARLALKAGIKFGGTGADGALAITTGTTTINLGSAAVVVKNYTSISITGDGVLAFSNPHANGTMIILKSQGNVTLTSSATPMISVASLGSTGAGFSLFNVSTIGGNGQNGGSGNNYAGGGGGGGAGYQSGSAGGNGGGNPIYGTPGTGGVASSVYTTIGSKVIPFVIGSLGGVGGVYNGSAGGGGRGGGALYIECGGALNFTTASGISCAGAVGGNATSGNSSGGGGGGAGSVVILANTITGNTGTITISGGAGGNGFGSYQVGGGAGGAGYSLVALNTEFA